MPDQRQGTKQKRPEPKPVVLPFPLKGVDRSLPVEQQPKFTCPDALNVVAFPPLSDRAGGGKRDGTSKESTGRLGSINSSTLAINHLLAVNLTNTGASPTGGGIPTTWANVGDGLNAAGVCLMPWDDANELNIAGGFTLAGGATATKVCTYNTATGAYINQAVGLPNTRSVPGRFLIWDAGDGSGECLYLVGGNKTGSVNQVARYNGTSWTDLGAGTTGITAVHDLCVVNGKLIVVGQFSQMGSAGTASSGCSNVAYWDPGNGIGTWLKLSEAGAPTTEGVSGGSSIAYSICTAPGVASLSATSPEIVDMVYIGGAFTVAGGTTCAGVAQFDTVNSHWDAMGQNSFGAVLGVVQTLKAIDLGDGTRIYIGGSFAGWQADASGHVGRVSDFVRGNHLSDHSFITAYDPNSGYFTPLQNGLRGLVNSLGYGVRSIEFYNDGVSPGVWVAGRFNAASTSDGLGLASASVAKWDGREWTAPAKGLAGDSTTCVNHMVPAGVLTDQQLYATGSFTIRNNVAVNGLAVWDGSTWSSLTGGGCHSPGAQSFNSMVVPVTTLVNDAVPKLYVSVYNAINSNYIGSFGVGPMPPLVGSLGAHYPFATWDGARWSDITGWTPNSLSLYFPFCGLVANVNSTGNKLYVGGNFLTSVLCPTNRIGAWNGSSWETMLTGGVSLTGDCYALAHNGSTLLYAGGAFGSSAGPTPGAGGVANTFKIAQWTGTAWQAIPGGGVTGASATVDALYYDTGGALLYIGGSFIDAGGALGGVADTAYIGTWSPGGATYAALDKGLNARVRAITFFGGIPYACGNFTADGRASAMLKIAKWDSGTTRWLPVSGGLTGGEARCMLVHDDGSGSKLYVGGDFTAFVNGSASTSCGGIARWDGTTWTAVDRTASVVRGFGTRIGAPCVSAMCVYNSQLVVAGSIIDASGDTATYFCRGDTA